MNIVVRVCRNFMSSHPLVVHSLEAGTLMGVGDVIAQKLVEKKPLEEINLYRTAHFASVGFIFVGPALSVWYKFLAQRFGSSSKTAVLKKVACDQFLFIPPFLTVVVGSLGINMQDPIQGATKHLKEHYPAVLMANYKLWPLVQMFNFYLVPLKQQVLVVQIVALFWNTYLSWRTKSAEYLK